MNTRHKHCSESICNQCCCVNAPSYLKTKQNFGPFLNTMVLHQHLFSITQFFFPVKKKKKSISPKSFHLLTLTLSLTEKQKWHVCNSKCHTSDSFITTPVMKSPGNRDCTNCLVLDTFIRRIFFFFSKETKDTLCLI